jgi:hypothetical protein
MTLSKLRAKGLVAKLPNSRRYQLLPQGIFVFERVYAPLTAGLLSPVSADARVDRLATETISNAQPFHLAQHQDATVR